MITPSVFQGLVPPRNTPMKLATSLANWVLPPGGTLQRNSWSARRRAAVSFAAVSNLQHAPAAMPAEAPSADADADATAAARTHLAELVIRDFALVEEQRVPLSPGLNVITGESGSGKSVLVEALGQLLGAPASEDIVRPPADAAVVEGLILVAVQDRAAVGRLLRQLGVPQKARSVEALRLKREILQGPGGTRSRCSLNGAATSLRVLREVGQALVDVNGQHAAVAMRDASTQLALLDRLGGTAAAAAAVAAAWRRLQAVREALRAVEELADEEKRAELQALVDEVGAAGVEAGEDAALRRRLRQLDSRRSAAERCRLVSVGIGGGSGGIVDALSGVEIHLRAVLGQEERLAAFEGPEQGSAEEEGPPDASAGAAAGVSGGEEAAAALLHGAMGSLHAAREALAEGEAAVERYARRYRFSQTEYDEASSRLQLLERLFKRHDSTSVDGLLAAAAAAEAALDSYFQMEGRRDELAAELAATEAAARAGAGALSAARRAAAARLCISVEGVLGELSMGGSRFDVRLRWTPCPLGKAGEGLEMGAAEAEASGERGGVFYRVTDAGLDSAEFLFASGPEEPLRPMASVASGGESARLMLAMKAAPAAFSQAAGTLGDAEAARMGHSVGADGKSAEELSAGAPIVVLDEVDSGVGSRLGQPIGRILRRMAGAPYSSPGNQSSRGGGGGPAASQILCISHLPQVAAHAEHHLCVRKGADAGGRVVTRFVTLSSFDERLQEVAAMLGLPRDAAIEVMAAAEAGAS